jgi:RNA polymerase sigma-70 factor (ECF subfamily)
MSIRQRSQVPGGAPCPAARHADRIDGDPIDRRLRKSVDTRGGIGMILAVADITPTKERAAQTSSQDAVIWLRAIAEERDRDAFERLYGQFAPKIKSYMIRQGADDGSADDLAQETLVQVWRKAESYDPDKAAPSAWIYRIARNLRIDRLRRQKFFEVELTAEADRADEGSVEYHRATERPDADKLRTLVETLPTEQLEVVRLAFFEGLSHSEIGQHLAVPLGTVKSRLRLAFGKLRAGMGEQA